MFSNFAWSEMLVIAVVAIIVVGPKDLPGMLRTFGKTLGSVKRMAGDFQRQFNDALREAEVDDLKDIASTKGFAPLEDAKKSMEELAQSMNEPMDSEIEAPAAAPAEETKPKTVKKTPQRKATAKTAAVRKTRSKTNGAKAPAPKAAPAKKPASKKPRTTKAAAPKTKAEAKSTS
ncbi:MAG: Sec-independent protein translocase protein TatB [Pseudomonadota bacterium]